MNKTISTILISIGALFLALNVYLNLTDNWLWPLYLLAAAAALGLIVFALPRKNPWLYALLIPAALLVALGITLLYNVLTLDWNAWIYAWMLIAVGAGWGTAVASRLGRWKAIFHTVALWTILAGTIGFSLLGMILGGYIVRIFIPLLFIAEGILFRQYLLKPYLQDSSESEAALPEPSIRKRISGQEAMKALPEPLSERELDVLHLIDQGLSNQQIATRLVVAQSTVKTHINNIYAKLEVENRVQAVNRAKDLGLFEER